MAADKNREQEIRVAFQKAKSDADKIWELATKDIPEPDALLLFQGKPAVFKNTIMLVQGKTGVHKSRLTSSIVSLLVSEEPSKKLLGFQSASEDKKVLIYCDTERNINNQLPSVIKQISKDANIDIESLKSRFTILPLANTIRSDRTLVMGRQFNELRKNEDVGTFHFVIILDILTDLVGNFNDVEATMGLIDLINNAINSIDVTFILVIHENPGGMDKARGHLGTEFSNKASTIFQISESSMEGIFRLKMLKSRSTEKIGELMLKFDPVVNNLVIVTDSNISLTASDPELIKLCDALSKNLFTTMGRNDLIKYLEVELKWGKRKIDEKLKKLVELEFKFETNRGDALLSKLRGKTAEYKMNYIDLPVEILSEEEVFG